MKVGNSINKHYIGHRQRLKARVLRFLSDVQEYELLEYLLTFAQPRRDVKPQAKAILEKHGTIRGMVEEGALNTDVIEGVGKNMSWYCEVLTEIARRYKAGLLNHERQGCSEELRSPKEIIAYIEEAGVYKSESALWVICLDIMKCPMHIYDFDFTLPNKDFVAFMLELLPQYVVLVKKVPQSTYVPNMEDIALLKKREKSLLLFDITILDYVIFTTESGISLYQYSLLTV